MPLGVKGWDIKHTDKNKKKNIYWLKERRAVGVGSRRNKASREKKKVVRVNQSDWNGCVAVCSMGSKIKKIFRREQEVYILTGLGRTHWLIA